MCELLGMSANVPTDIVFSFTGFRMRGGKRAPHKDGWGIAFYEGKGLRRASVGRVALENTHPFVRELWGRFWVFAHNGRVAEAKKRPLGAYLPVGTTDSEHAFCWILEELRRAFPAPPTEPGATWRLIHEMFGDRVAVIATTPLTSNEIWTRCGKDEFGVFRAGERIA